MPKKLERYRHLILTFRTKRWAAFRIGVLQLFNIAGVLLMIVVNGLADLLSIGGSTTAIELNYRSISKAKTD